MNYKLVLCMIALFFSTVVLANANQVKANRLNNQQTESRVALSGVLPVFSIESGSKLTLALVDECWNQREDKHNQKVIANYLLTNPVVPNDYETAWKTARLVYFVGNFGYGERKFRDSKDGIKLFKYGADAGKIAFTLEPKKIEGYYWYAVDLGSYGLAKGLLYAATNAKDGIRALKIAQKIDPDYEGYGSSRILGRYYQELPGIFGGSSKKALALFTEATKKDPNFKSNWLFLGQFYLSEKKYSEAISACKKVLLAPKSEGKFEELRYKKDAKECVSLSKQKLS